MTNSKTPLLGAHVSAAGGAFHAIEHGEQMGASCIQIFGASPRQWKAQLPPEDVIEKFKAAQKQSGVRAVFLHAAYLINLAAVGEELYKKSIECLSGHLLIAEALGAQGVVFHINSTPETSKEFGLKRTAEGIKKVLHLVPGHAKLLMENNAGSPAKLGSRLEDLAALRKAVDSDRVGICIDTAHTLGSGLVKEFSKAGVKDFADRIEKTVGLKHLYAIHANDSKMPAESYKDRHENIGEGYIGLSGFKNLAAEKRLHQAAWILEVPGFDDMGPDKKNLDILKSCF